MESWCSTVGFAGKDLSVLKGYFKPSSLSLALITGPEPARDGKMFQECFQCPAKHFQP